MIGAILGAVVLLAAWQAIGGGTHRLERLGWLPQVSQASASPWPASTSATLPPISCAATTRLPKRPFRRRLDWW